MFWTASFSHIDEESGSKMDIHNLSTVITPNILYTRKRENGQTDSSEGYFCRLKQSIHLFGEYDRFAKVPAEVLDILHGEFGMNEESGNSTGGIGGGATTTTSVGNLPSKEILHESNNTGQVKAVQCRSRVQL